MALRIRDYSIPGTEGVYSYQSTIIDRRRPLLAKGYCEDVSNNRHGINPFLQRAYHVTPVVFDHVDAMGFSRKNWPVDVADLNLFTPPDALGAWSPEFKSVNVAMANSHPGEPAVSLPNFIFELKDLPRMYKHAAERLGKKHPKPPPKPKSPADKTKDRADDYLAYTFAWAPFISDIFKMAEVAKWTRDRARLIRKSQAIGFVSRERTCGDFRHSQIFGGQPWALNGSSTRVDNYTARRWVNTRWQYNGNLPIETSLSAQQSRLVPAALGLSISFQQMWDAMPWSWMVDYFTDLSSIISVHENRAGFSFFGGCYMTESRTVSTFTPEPGHPVQGPVVSTLTKKERMPHAPFLHDVGLNFLSGRQLTTLSALTVSKVLS